MNIFEEIVQSYIYNGAVSLKALEDDIVTLENQIDSYNATLREIQIRGKKSLPLIEKIRDAKIRLSLLKAVYRRESDKATPDDVIINMLGLSAKDAKETESPGTAADKKEPVPQNFDKAEIEIVDDDAESTVVENETLVDNEMPAENVVGDTNKETTDICIETDECDDVEPGTSIEKTKDSDAEVVEENVAETEEYSTVGHKEDKVTEHNAVKPEITVDEESAIVTVGKITESAGDFFIPNEEKNTEENKEPVKLEKFDVSEEFYNPAKVNNEEFFEFYSELNNEDAIHIIDDSECVMNEQEIPTNDCPPPTIDDYFEPIEGEEIIMNINDDYMEHKATEYINEVSENTKNKAVEYNKEPEIQEVKATVTEDKEEHDDGFDVFEPFSDEKTSLVASLCLTDVTDLVNTMRVYGTMNPEKRLLIIRFVDIRDYEVFVKLLKEREEERHRMFNRFGKKRRSIFMYVTASVGDSTQNYKYEFTNCRITEVVDSEYASKMCMEGSYIPFEDCSYHNCGVTFKYKKLKIT